MRRPNEWIASEGQAAPRSPAACDHTPRQPTARTSCAVIVAAASLCGALDPAAAQTHRADGSSPSRAASSDASKKPVAATPPARAVPAATAPAPAPASQDDDDDEPDDEVGEHDGTIVRIEGDLLYFDVGSERGLRIGQSVRVLRTIIAKHPVTGKRLVDHFPLGTLSVEGVGSVLSYGRVQRRIGPLVKIGDVVNVSQPAEKRAATSTGPASPAAAERSRSAPSPTAASAPAASATTSPDRSGAASSDTRPVTVPAAVAEPTPAQQVQQVFERALGRPLSVRIQIFEDYLTAHRDSPFRATIEQELAHLRATQQTLAAAAEQLARARQERTRAGDSDDTRSDLPIANVLVPRRIQAGEPLEVTVYVGNPGNVRQAVLYVRRDGDYTYQLAPFKEDATGYFRILVPSRLLTAGTVELFVGLHDVMGRQSIHAGSAERPSQVVIDPPIGPPPPPGPNHSAISGFFEYVDFNRFRGNDYYFNAEADFMYRIGGVLYSVRTGFGTLSGYGESVRNLDELMLSPRPVGFNYGYVEGELRFHRLVGLAARGLAGQSRAGAGGGAELKLRIGSELGTNLVIGGAIISDFGALAQLKLEWNVIRSWPMSVTVVATNQPVQTDLGVRLIYQVGWRFKHWFAPTARIGYDVRNINHGGLSLGLGVVMGW